MGRSLIKSTDDVRDFCIYKLHCRSVCLLAPNIFRLKSERYETHHVGSLECLRMNGFLNFDLIV